jgi:hypothetical protein
LGKLIFKKKTHLGSGNFEYTYDCFCSPRPLKEIKVTAGNDNEAEQLAQPDCDEYCKNVESEITKELLK